MPWFEATDDIQISPNRYVRPGDRFEYPYRAGKALVSANRAEWAEAPSTDDEPRSDTAGTDTDTNEPDEVPETDADVGGHEDDSVDVSEIDFTDVDGIGEETADEIEAWLAGEGIETVAALTGRGLTALPGVGPSTAEDIRDAFEVL